MDKFTKFKRFIANDSSSTADGNFKGNTKVQIADEILEFISVKEFACLNVHKESHLQYLIQSKRPIPFGQVLYRPTVKHIFFTYCKFQNVFPLSFFFSPPRLYGIVCT